MKQDEANRRSPAGGSLTRCGSALSPVLSLVTVLLLAGTSGCAKMQVRVSVLDRERVRDTAPFVQAEARRARDGVLANRRQGLYEQQRAQTKIALHRALDTVLKDEAARAISIDDVTRAALRDAMDREVDTTFESASLLFDQGIAELVRLENLSAQYPGQRLKLAASARQYFARGNEQLSRLRFKLDHFFTQLLPGAFAVGEPGVPAAPGRLPDAIKSDVVSGAAAASPATVAAAQRPLQEQARRIEGLIGGAGLMGDPATALVVSAPNRYWRGTFNRTYGNGVFGNTDIAVKMEDIGNFTLKGVRNDATKTTPAAFQGALLMAKVAAASMGVPVGALGGAAGRSETPAAGDAGGGDTDAAAGGAGDGTATAGGAAATSPGADLAEARQTTRDAERQTRLSKLAALQVLRAITQQRGAVMKEQTGDEAADKLIIAARNAAVAQVKASFTSNRALLEMQTPTQP